MSKATQILTTIQAAATLAVWIYGLWHAATGPKEEEDRHPWH